MTPMTPLGIMTIPCGVVLVSRWIIVLRVSVVCLTVLCAVLIGILTRLCSPLPIRIMSAIVLWISVLGLVLGKLTLLSSTLGRLSCRYSVR